MESIKQILALELFDVTLFSALMVLVSVLSAFVIDRIVQSILRAILKRIIARGQREMLNGMLTASLQKPLHVLVLTLGSVFGLVIIETPTWAESLFALIFVGVRALSIWCLVWFLLRLTKEFTQKMQAKVKQTEDKLDDMLVPVISGLVKFVLISMGVLLVIQNLGYSVTSLVAGLGIGGAALALASKDTLANFFGSLVVFFDHPFVIGDWISLNGVEGAVEEIRLRTTMIRTFENSLVMMPNAMFTSTSIENYERRGSRKMNCSFTLVYTTTAAQIEQIVSEIKQHINDNPKLYTSTYFIGFGGFGESGLEVVVEAYTLTTGRSAHFDDRQVFMLEIMKIVEKAGTSFALPTRTIHMGPSVQPTKPMMVNVVSQ